jgi:hypothetical protein
MTNLKLMSYFEVIATPSITTFSIMTLSIKGLYVTLNIKGMDVTLSIMTLSFQSFCVTLSINDNNHNNSLRSGASLCRASQFIYCYVEWRHFEGVTTLSRATFSILVGLYSSTKSHSLKCRIAECRGAIPNGWWRWQPCLSLSLTFPIVEKCRDSGRFRSVHITSRDWILTDRCPIKLHARNFLNYWLLSQKFWRMIRNHRTTHFLNGPIL